MSNFHITSSYGWGLWLFFLLIPAVIFTLLPYFRLNKRYRRTRNRIVSMILHLAVMVLSVSALTGIRFVFDRQNTDNEVILLVDVSQSGENAQEDRDEFIRTVVDEHNEAFRVGIVTFGYTQVYAAPLSVNTDRVYEQYLSAELPDVTATDFSAAFRYARDLFTENANKKIVLISDGFETDAKAKNVIKSIAAAGIRVDTVYLPAEHGPEVQLVSATPPDYSLAVGVPFDMEVTLQSSFEGPATLTLYDNENEPESVEVTLSPGVQTVAFNHAFALPGMHELRFSLTSNGDTLSENNSFYSYIYLETFDKILIVERNAGESEQLERLLSKDYSNSNAYNVDIVSVSNAEEMPSTLDELRAYDQVILVNIANRDMPEGFAEILNSYVYEVGGGLFTVGGNRTENGEEVANAYNREDLYGSLYQQMLPVQAINYTPPLGVMIVIDRSGSMEAGDTATGETKLDLAKRGARACLNALTERDYCGIMTLESDFSEEIEMTPATQRSKIADVIEDIEIGGGTNFAPALERACLTLSSLSQVEKRHIILVTDGMPGDSYENADGATGYGWIIEHYHETAGITLSIVSIDTPEDSVSDMERAAEAGGGKFYNVWDIDTLPRVMRDDLNIPQIKESDVTEFTPQIRDHTAVVNGVRQEDMPKLYGFYGTKLKEGATEPLAGEYVPIYAQWKYGKGSVGSFMCDLNGTWSGDFLSSATGVQILSNVVRGLFPTENIRPREIDAVLEEENYTTQINVYADLEIDDTIEVTITSPAAEDGGEPVVQHIVPTTAEGFTRIRFVVTTPGIHEVLIQRKNGAGEVTAEYLTYKAFSWSKEYDVFADAEECEAFLESLAVGGGSVLTEGWQVFENFAGSYEKVIDPVVPFIIAAIVLFLLDIAVRKFKFKWLHEIIRDRKATEELRHGRREGASQ